MTIPLISNSRFIASKIIDFHFNITVIKYKIYKNIYDIMIFIIIF